MKNPVINIDTLNYESYSHGDSFEAESAAVANLIGASKLGYNITRVPPGKSACPCHSHLVNEEMFFIIEGEGTFKQSGHAYPLRKGDVIAAVTGKENHHEIINTGPEALLYMAVSTMEAPDVCFYPVSNKFGVMAGSPPGRAGNKDDFRFFGRESDAKDYWEGEN